MARDEEFRIKAYHLENGIFAAADFQELASDSNKSFHSVG
jgi:hypothetical protein